MRTRPRLIFAEVKASGGTVSLAQAHFLRLARDVGRQDDLVPSSIPVGAYLWFPGDEEMIEGILKTRVLA